jgi:hypothetical protein
VRDIIEPELKTHKNTLKVGFFFLSEISTREFIRAHNENDDRTKTLFKHVNNIGSSIYIESELYEVMIDSE